jgi:hypothetical protein
MHIKAKKYNLKAPEENPNLKVNQERKNKQALCM